MKREPNRSPVLLGFALAFSFLSSQAGAVELTAGNLSGTLESPPGKGPFPLVLIVAGSGPVDRDGNSPKGGLDTDCYKLLADALAAQGIATLRYDKRGVGQSAVPDLDERLLTVSAFVDDAAAWIQKLWSDPRFSTLTVLGHSEGALVGLLAAQRIPVDGYISVAGAGEPLAKLLLGQLEQHLSPPDYRSARSIVTNLDRGIVVRDVPTVLNPVLRPSVQPFLISLFRVNPVEGIAKLRMPVLIVQGGHDLQVSVDDAQALAKAAPSARLEILPNMNHVFKDVEGTSLRDNLETYRDPKHAVDPRFVDVVTDFVHQLRRQK
ncbi:MAG TPA: alpha/beta fold hydrolase [Rhizomicrobium sp.]|jgi:hypothetical protein|nr:alpha/beta fold hydrolase [Rhizomicrobium sp.]